jgi:hypothetical protein
VLTPVIEVAALTVFYPWQELALGRAVALQLVGNDDAGNVREALEELAKKLLGGLLIAPALSQDVEHIIVLVDGAPQVMALAIDGEENLVQMPFIPRARPSALQLIRLLLPKLPTPLTDGLVGHVDATLEQEFLHVAVAQREARIEPDSMADDFAGKAVVLVAFRVSGWSHIGGFS